MAKASYAPLFETVSGALNKINKKSQHAEDQKMVLATHRVAETTSKGCSRVYLRDLASITRTTPVTVHEIEIRTLFQQRLSWVNARAKSLSTLTSDQENFLAQKDAAGGAKTWKKYLWKLAKETIAAEGE